MTTAAARVHRPGDAERLHPTTQALLAPAAVRRGDGRGCRRVLHRKKHDLDTPANWHVGILECVKIHGAWPLGYSRRQKAVVVFYYA